MDFFLHFRDRPVSDDARGGRSWDQMTGRTRREAKFEVRARIAWSGKVAVPVILRTRRCLKFHVTCPRMLVEFCCAKRPCVFGDANLVPGACSPVSTNARTWSAFSNTKVRSCANLRDLAQKHRGLVPYDRPVCKGHEKLHHTQKVLVDCVNDDTQRTADEYQNTGPSYQTRRQFHDDFENGRFTTSSQHTRYN